MEICGIYECFECKRNARIGFIDRFLFGIIITIKGGDFKSPPLIVFKECSLSYEVQIYGWRSFQNVSDSRK